MASSGWQGQKDIITAFYPHMALNLDVWDVVHSGSTLTFKATVRAVVTSGNIYCNNVSVSLTGGGSITRNMNPVSTGGYVDFGTFNCSVSVPAETTSYTVASSLSSGCSGTGGNNIHGNTSWTLDIGSGASAPSGATVSIAGSTYNSVSGQFKVSNWGGTGSGHIEARLYGASGTAYLKEEQDNVSSLTTTITNGSTAVDGGITILGCGTYSAETYASNSAGNTTSSRSTVYTPPAPVSLTYIDPGGSGTKVYPITFTGIAADNTSDYTTSELKRSLRYKIGSGVWVTVVNDVQAAITDVSTFNLSLSAGATATVEAWMAYRGLNSQVASVVIANDAPANVLYGSVNGQAKKVVKLYGSVNGQAKEITKLYGSVNGVAKKIYEA